MRDYDAQRDWQVISEYIELGASAKTAERPELQRLLTTLREAKERVDILLVHKIDRLAPSVFDHATIKALLKQRDIRLASVVENIDESVLGQLVENIMASIAQFYSVNLSEEVKKERHGSEGAQRRLATSAATRVTLPTRRGERARPGSMHLS